MGHDRNEDGKHPSAFRSRGALHGGSLKFYFAGRISQNDWRCEILGRREPSADADVGQEGAFYKEWETTVIAGSDHMYVGPYFISCDHSCFHGSGKHGAGADGWGCCGLEGQGSAETVRRCLKGVRECDVVFAWLEPDAYGTVAELGYAKAFNKKIAVAFDDALPPEDLWFAAEMADIVIHGKTAGAAFAMLIGEEASRKAREREKERQRWLSGDATSQSPVEKMMFQSFVRAAVRCRSDYYRPHETSPGVPVGWRDGVFVISDGNLWTVRPQFEIGKGKYFLDFAILPFKIAIEVDGHQHHERTKEQAARDKKRDRYLVADGWRVLRFTGSEVYRNADKCVDEALTLAVGR